MSKPRVTYVPRHDATPESELKALATVYKFLLDRRVSKDAADLSTQSDTRKEVPNETLKK